MNRAVTLLGLLAATSLAAQQPAPAVAKFTVAGIPVILKPIAANEVIAVRLYLRGGSANLTPATAGIERFIGAMATQGTAKYGKDAFAARATATGVEFSAEADRDYTVFTARGVREHWDETWDLFTQAALHPTFPETEIGVARDQILNDLRQRHDDADTYLRWLADSALFTGHPYAVDATGAEASITKLTRADLARWHAQRMTKENLLLVVVGNVPRPELQAKVAAAFGALPARGGTAVVPPAPPARTPSVTVVQRDLPTNYVVGEFPTVGLADGDYPALRAAMEILSDRLFEEVRTKRNLSYAVFAGLQNHRANTGIIYVTAVEPDTTLKVMLAEVQRLQEEPISLPRIGQSINTYLTQYLMGQEANMSQADRLGRYELLGGGWQRAEALINQIRAVRPEEIQRVAQRYLRNFTFAVIGDSTKIDRKLFTSR
jgi:zinc protease